MLTALRFSLYALVLTGWGGARRSCEGQRTRAVTLQDFHFRVWAPDVGVGEGRDFLVKDVVFALFRFTLYTSERARGKQREREKEREREREKGLGGERRCCEEYRTVLEGRYKAIWKREFKLPWRRAGLLKSSR